MSFVGRRAADRFHADQEQVAELERGIAMIPGAELELLEPELNVSGGRTLDKRPSLKKAVEGVEAGRYAGIIVAYLSRLGRNVREQLAVWDRVEAAGGRIIVVREGIDTSTASGRLQRNLLLAIAEHEREQHDERFEERVELSVQAGIWQRRQTPRGYRRDEDTRRLVPDERADDVRWAFQQRIEGQPLTRIADRLGMTTGGVRHLLRNRVYLGELKVRSYVNPTAHEPIVSQELFDAAQEHIVARAPVQMEQRALLAGLVRCEGCGHVMSRSRSGSYHTYACHRRHSLGHCEAPGTVMQHLLDAHVEEVVLSYLRLLSARKDNDRDARLLRDAIAAEQAAERELEAFLEGVQAAGLEPADWAAGARTRREARDEARKARKRAQSVRPAATARAGVEVWENGTVEQRHALLRGLIETVVVRAAGGRRLPTGERVRVIAAGSGFVPDVLSGDRPYPLVRLPFPDLDDPAVLGVLVGDDALEGGGEGA